MGLSLHGFLGDDMQFTGNTILITGGGSGIGLGLAKEFHALGNKVIIAGRRKDVLDAAVKTYPGMASYAMDIQSADGIKEFASWLTREHPGLNVLINNAGVMRAEKLTEQKGLEDMEAIVATNLLGPLRLTAALLPALLKQPRAVVVNVSSGLAFVPMAITPTYCATKAALHSYTQSLRWQLKETGVKVLELIPPYVATDLMDGAKDPNAMPLGEFISEVMEIIKESPQEREICVERVRKLRLAGESINYDHIYSDLNSGR